MAQSSGIPLFVLARFVKKKIIAKLQLPDTQFTDNYSAYKEYINVIFKQINLELSYRDCVLYYIHRHYISLADDENFHKSMCSCFTKCSFLCNPSMIAFINIITDKETAKQKIDIYIEDILNAIEHQVTYISNIVRANYESVDKAFLNSKCGILVLRTVCYLECLYYLEQKYNKYIKLVIVYKEQLDCWSFKAISDEFSSMKNRWLADEGLRGLNGEDLGRLIDVTDYNNLFVHRSGFTGAGKTFEIILKLINYNNDEFIDIDSST